MSILWLWLENMISMLTQLIFMSTKRQDVGTAYIGNVSELLSQGFISWAPQSLFRHVGELEKDLKELSCLTLNSRSSWKLHSWDGHTPVLVVDLGQQLGCWSCWKAGSQFLSFERILPKPQTSSVKVLGFNWFGGWWAYAQTCLDLSQQNSPDCKGPWLV